MTSSITSDRRDFTTVNALDRINVSQGMGLILVILDNLVNLVISRQSGFKG